MVFIYTPQDSLPKNKLPGLIIGFILFVIGGWSMIFLFPGFGTPLITTIIALFTLAYIWLFVKWLMNPKKFKEEQIVADQNMQNTVSWKDSIGGVAGAVVQVINAVSSMSGGTTVRTEWYVEAQLDIPGAIDMRKKIVINVG